MAADVDVRCVKAVLDVDDRCVVVRAVVRDTRVELEVVGVCAIGTVDVVKVKIAAVINKAPKFKQTANETRNTAAYCKNRSMLRSRYRM